MRQPLPAKIKFETDKSWGMVRDPPLHLRQLFPGCCYYYALVRTWCQDVGGERRALHLKIPGGRGGRKEEESFFFRKTAVASEEGRARRCSSAGANLRWAPYQITSAGPPREQGGAKNAVLSLKKGQRTLLIERTGAKPRERAEPRKKVDRSHLACR